MIDRAFVLWHNEMGFCEGHMWGTQKRVREHACDCFKRTWQEMKWSGFSVREIVFAGPSKNGWPLVGDDRRKAELKRTLKAIDEQGKIINKDKESALAFLVELGMCNKKGKLKKRYGGTV